MPKKAGFDNFQVADTVHKFTSNANWGRRIMWGTQCHTMKMTHSSGDAAKMVFF